MTELGVYLSKRSINKASVGRRTGITAQRLNALTKNPDAHLRVKELYLIALAIEVDPCELLMLVCKDMKLEGEE
jgi:putative transcriptional regulator